MAIGCKMRGLGESTYYMNNLKPKMDNLMGEIPYEMEHIVGERKVLMRLDSLGETMKPQIETLMESELPKANRIEYDPLPYGYTRVDYLESHGKTMYGEQYIDTNIVFTTAMILRADLEPTSYPTTDGHYLFGSDQQAGTNKNYIYARAMGNSGSWMFYNGINGSIANITLMNKTILERFVITYDGKQKIAKYKGTTYKMVNSEGPLPTRFMLFTLSRHAPWNNTADKISPTASGKCRFYSFYAEEGETKIDLIPVLDPTGAPCMFDLVSKTPFYNSGTGDFLYPSPTATYSLRRYTPEYAIKTTAGIRKLYHVPENYDGSIEDYAKENNFKRLVESESPNEEGKFYEAKWHETDTELILEWIEVELPVIEEEIGEVPTEN